MTIIELYWSTLTVNHFFFFPLPLYLGMHIDLGREVWNRKQKYGRKTRSQKQEAAILLVCMQPHTFTNYVGNEKGELICFRKCPSPFSRNRNIFPLLFFPAPRDLVEVEVYSGRSFILLADHFTLKEVALHSYRQTRTF